MMRSAGENYLISAYLKFSFNIFISCKHINATNTSNFMAVKSLLIIAHRTFQMIHVLDSEE